MYLESASDGTKVGLDDFFAHGHTVQELLDRATDDLKPLPTEADDSACPYRATSSGLIWERSTYDGIVPTLLCNFTAHITAEIASDDGVETQRLMEIEVRRGDECRRVMIPSERFASMAWVTTELGARYVLQPGLGTKDQVRAAIQLI